MRTPPPGYELEEEKHDMRTLLFCYGMLLSLVSVAQDGMAGRDGPYQDGEYDGPNSGSGWYEYPTVWFLIAVALLGGLLWLRSQSRRRA